MVTKDEAVPKRGRGRPRKNVLPMNGEPEPMAGRRLEQKFIPGTEPETIPEVEQAVIAYEDAKEDHKDAGKELKDSAMKLMDRIRAAKLEKYQAASGKIYKLDFKAGIKTFKKKKVKEPKGSKA